MPLKMRVQQQPWYEGLSFLIIDEQYNYRSIGELIFHDEKKEDLGKIFQPTGNLSLESPQTLMDDLWHCGLRPSEGMGSAGQLKSTQEHLADMRKIVFKKLGID